MDPEKYTLQEETDLTPGMGIEIQKIPGAGFSEIVYKEAYEYEYLIRNILYEREKEQEVRYKERILPHKLYADLVVFGKVIVEIKTKEGGIAGEDNTQAINYLKVSY